MSDIQYTYPLIHNKVTSPHYVTPTLRRARLLDWLHGNAECRAVVIAADAGYGKTTLLWQWEREVDFPCYWYKLDRNDRDWSLHISYLIESISQRHAGFGRRAHSMLQQLGGPGSSRPGVAAFLLSEMHQRLTEPCTFIIDDWQYVNSVTEVRGLWNQLLRDAPPTCRFVFASRAKPRLQFARFKTHAGYGELRTDALRFNDREIDELFREIYQDPLDPAELAELERRTEGWAASLQLVEVSLRERLTPASRLDFINSIAANSDSDLFAFLAEEVLDQQPDDTRNFLLTTSIAQQLTPELAERLAGVHDGARELVDLEQRGLFTNRLDDARYRYHPLFRDFLQRRLMQERGPAEVVGLHIHAASYFETTHHWPQAIHHYLQAGLQRQAARLMARFGEEVVAEGRLGLVDEWLAQLPERSVRENARLSLLYGETCGIRGNWVAALEALNRARSYFSRKGDSRLEALACLKLSTVYSNYGDADRAAGSAGEGLDLVPLDAAATRLRLEGNLALTRTWLTDDLQAVATACKRIALEARSLGLEHFAAIALHNLGTVQRHLGDVDEAIVNLERAATFWEGSSASPFADNSELVFALLAADRVQQAEQIAETAVQRTEPWPRPQADALMGRAAVYAHQGRFREAIAVLTSLSSAPTYLGTLNEPLGSLLLDCLFLNNSDGRELGRALATIQQGPSDPRHEVTMAPARSLVHHRSGRCRGECTAARAKLGQLDGRGEHLIATLGYVKLALLGLEHGGRKQTAAAVEALERVRSAQLARLLKWWLRRFSRYAIVLATHPRGPGVLEFLLEADPEGWRTTVASVVDRTSEPHRERLLNALVRHGNRAVVEALKSVPGPDIVEARRLLVYQQAARIFIRSFGSLAVHRGGWGGPRIHIEKRRQRMLLGLLISHNATALTRDAALDLLWPDADPAAAINSLNQTVFQLRRVLDPVYKDGESPQYIISTVDTVELNPELMRTDLDEVRRLGASASIATLAQRRRVVEQLVSLVRGEFLPEVKYEDWGARNQMAIHAELRQVLLPIASSDDPSLPPDLAARAACTLIALDEFDEAAHLALAERLARAGKRTAAREVIARFARKLHDDLDEAPSSALAAALEDLGTDAGQLDID